MTVDRPDTAEEEELPKKPNLEFRGAFPGGIPLQNEATLKPPDEYARRAAERLRKALAAIKSKS